MNLNQLTQSFGQELKEILTDTAALNADYQIIQQNLREQYPNGNDGWYDFWATRLTILKYGGFDTTTLKFDKDPKDEPNLAQITLTFDYSS